MKKTNATIVQLTVLRIGALVIHSALQDGDAHSVRADLRVGGTDAALAIRGENKSWEAVADTLVANEDKTKLCLVADANPL